MISRFTSLVLRSVLLFTLAVAVLVQAWVLPWLATTTAHRFPEVAYLRWPVLVVSIAFVLCGEVVLVATWRLLDAVSHDRIFDEAAFPWVDAIVRALQVASLMAGVALVLLLWSKLGPLSVPVMALLGFLAVGGSLALMMVLRALLRRATQLQADLAEVI